MSSTYHIACEDCQYRIPLGKVTFPIRDAFNAVTMDKFTESQLELFRLRAKWATSKGSYNQMKSFLSFHRDHSVVLSSPDAGHGIGYLVVKYRNSQNGIQQYIWNDEIMKFVIENSLSK